MKKFLFVYTPDPMALAEDKTPLGILSLCQLLNKSELCMSFQICDFNELFYKRTIEGSSSFYQNVNKMVDIILDYMPDIIDFYTMCSNLYLDVIIANKIKEKFPDVIIIFAGPQATSVATELLNSYSFIDYIGMGEGEKTIINNVKGIVDSDKQLFSGLAYRDQNQIVTNWNCHDRIDVNSLDMVDYGVFYDELSLGSYITLEGGRGCPFTCTFCSTQKFWGNSFQVKSIEKLISEIQFYIKKYNINVFDINHDLFTFNKNYIIEFCKTLINKNININWSCSSRIDVIDKDMIEIMARSGCTSIFFGIESGSEKVQKEIRKKLNLNKIFTNLPVLLQENVSCAFSFIFGFSDEEDLDLEKTLNIVHKIKQVEISDNHTKSRIEIQLHRISYFPGTQQTITDYDALVFDRIEGLSYYNNSVNIPQDVIDMIKNEKDIYIHCFNLEKNNTDKKRIFGFFIELIFDYLYYYFYETFDSLFEEFGVLGFYNNFYDYDKALIYEICDYFYLKKVENNDYTIIKKFINNLPGFFKEFTCPKAQSKLEKEVKLFPSNLNF